MIKSKNYWWNNIDKLSEPLEPLTEEMFEKLFNNCYKEPPEYLYFTREATKLEWAWYKIREFCIGLYQVLTMKRIVVFENYYSKLLCAFLNTPALTLGNYILLGCYQDRYETLLHETTHYFRYQTNKWYIFAYIKKLLRKENK